MEWRKSNNSLLQHFDVIMKNIYKLFITSIFITFSAQFALSQSTTFSKVIDRINGNEFGDELLLMKDRYVIQCRGVIDPQIEDSKFIDYLLVLHLSKDEIGFMNFWEYLWSGSSNPFCTINDTIYLFGDSKSIPYFWNIYTFNIDGESLDILLYDELTENQVFAEGIQVKGDFFYLAGRTWGKDSWTTDEDLMIIKTDKQGNKIREERFWDIARPDMQNVIWDFKKTQDGNFALSFTGLDKDKEGSYKIAKLIKFNENLDTIWSKALNRHHGLAGFSYPRLAPTEDRGIVMTWSLFKRDIKEELGEDYSKFADFPPTIYKFDSLGNTIWADTMWTYQNGEVYPPQKSINKLINTKDDGVVGVGDYQNRYPIKNRLPWIFKYSKDGELLWEKVYKDVNYESDYSFLLDVKIADNGDIVCVGALEDKNGEFNNNSYTWLLRVDSMGCFEPGCCQLDTIQMIEVDSVFVPDTLDVEKNGVTIYPNPTSDVLTVLLPKVCSAQYSGENTGISYTIRNISGIMFKEGKIGQRAVSFDINVKDMPNGIYFLEVRDKGRDMHSLKKFVVE